MVGNFEMVSEGTKPSAEITLALSMGEMGWGKQEFAGRLGFEMPAFFKNRHQRH